jgi:hypothetical protein
VLFKAVTYEMLSDDAFRKVVNAQLPTVAQLLDEHDAAPEVLNG